MIKISSLVASKPLMALSIIFVICAVLVLYTVLASMLSIRPLFCGFIFSLYWAGVRHASRAEFFPALVGAVGGVLHAWALHQWPLLYGSGGLTLALIVLLVAIYSQIRGFLPILFNLSYMLFLTVATIPVVTAEGNFPGMVAAILLGGALLGGLFGSARFISGKRTQTEV